MSDKEIKDVGYINSNTNLQTVDTQDPVEDSFNNNCGNIRYPTRKASGVGDTPDLISEETPPLAILDLETDSDLYLFDTRKTSNAPTKGEGTEEMDVSQPRSPESSPSVNPISVENETSSQSDAAVAVINSETECKTELSVLPLPSTSTLATCIVVNDNRTPFCPFPSSHQTNMSTSDDKQNGGKLSLIVQEEQGNDAPENSLSLSSTDMNTRPESTEWTCIQKTLVHITSAHVIQNENEVSSTVNEKKGNSHTNESNMELESGAVSAPEEEQVDTGHSMEGDPASTFSDNITKSISIDESYDAGEPVLQQQQQNHPKNDSLISGNEDLTGSEALAAVSDTGQLTNSPPPLSGEKNLSSPIIQSRKVGGKSSRPRSKRKQSNGTTRNSGKSPIRVVEVYERNSPVEIKQSKSAKPLSPYQCKVFPVQNVSLGTSSSFTVNSKQRKILDKELTRGLERERLLLVEALTEYYNKQHQMSLDSPPCTAAGVEDDSIISNGSQRETYMSWVIKEKHRERMEETENKGEMLWNPMANIFRKSTFTQVSNRPSFTGKEQVSTEVNTETIVNSEPKPIIPDCRIRFVGHERENEIMDAGRTMYQSLKSLQKAIHLSDLFCFRNNAADLPLGESLSQPGFQQFMESENEIEVLENIMTLLGDTKDDVKIYLESLEKANLATKDDSGLTKIEISNNNELSEDKYENEIEKDNPEETDSTAKNQDQELVLFTCPSCQSQMDLEISNPSRSGIYRDRVLPQVYTFTGEQGKITLSTYYTTESKSLVHTALCEGHMYQTHFSASDPSGPLQGITKAKKEYLGQPSHLSLEILLSTIHRCSSYIDTRIACSCVWTRQSKRYLLELIESYLEKQYKPATDLSRWTLYNMERKLKRINVFAGVIRAFSEELVEAVNKIHFCMQKSRVFLNKNLREPEMPGFSINSTNPSWEDIKSELGSISLNNNTPKCSFHEYCEMSMASSVERLYNKLNTTTRNEGNGPSANGDVSLQILMQIVAQAAKDIEMASNLAEYYAVTLRMPGKKARRVLRFMNTTLSQLGSSKDIQFGTLVATFLSVVDKLSLFEEFMCEQKVEIRARVHQMCLKIIRKLYDLRANLCMQMNWSINLAKNSYMRIREINEIKRIKKLKKADRHINEKIEFLRGSDGSLRASVC